MCLRAKKEKWAFLGVFSAVCQIQNHSVVDKGNSRAQITLGIAMLRDRAEMEGGGKKNQTKQCQKNKRGLPKVRLHGSLDSEREKATVGTGRTYLGRLKRDCQNCSPCPLDSCATEVTFRQCSYRATCELVQGMALLGPP